jgi:hypothetical protein
MEFLIIAIVIIVGFAVFLFTIGHLLLVARIALPITRVLVMFGAFEGFNMRTMSKRFILYFYFLQAIISSVLIITAITLGFLLFAENLFPYLVAGYFLGCLMVVFNWFVRQTYSFSKNSFHVWYLDSFRKHINFDVLHKMNLDNEDKLFEVISTWVTPEAQKKVKELMKK